MFLDFRSVIFSCSVLLLLLGSVFCVYALSLRPRLREFAIWAMAYCLLILGAFLALVRGLIPDFFSIVLCNLFLLEFFGLVRAGVVVHYGAAPRWRLLIGGAAFALLWYSAFTFVWPSLPVRLYSYNGTIVVLCWWTMATVHKRREKGSGIASLLAAYCFGAMGTLSLARIVLSSLTTLPSDIMGLSAWDSIIQALMSASSSVLALALILMQAERLNARLAQAAESRELLVREMAHRTKNDLALVDSLISLEEGAISSACSEGSAEAGVTRLEALRERIRCMAQAHERLSLSESPGLVHVEDYLEAVAEGLPSRPNVRIGRSFASVELPFAMALPMGLIMNELATNSLKYAYPDGEPGTVALSLVVVEGKGGGRRASLSVRDSGRGCSWPPEHPGLGSAIIEALAAKLGAEISCDVSSGSAFTVSFDLPSAPRRSA